MNARLKVFHDLCEENGFLDIHDELMVYHKFFELVERFQKLSKITGYDKGSSYHVDLQIDLHDPKYGIELGTYDISDWPRTTVRTGMNRFKELVENLEYLVEEAEVAVTLNKEDI